MTSIFGDKIKEELQGVLFLIRALTREQLCVMSINQTLEVVKWAIRTLQLDLLRKFCVFRMTVDAIRSTLDISGQDSQTQA